jgi:hypothetical protein
LVSAPLSAKRSEADSKARLRLWIRLLRASRLIEGITRERLKAQFNATLPRFDVMSALYRQPDGMLMSEISRFLMVSNGNVTGIVERLVSDGFVGPLAAQWRPPHLLHQSYPQGPRLVREYGGGA